MRMPLVSRERGRYGLSLMRREGPQTAEQVLAIGQYHPFTYPSWIMYSMACGYMVHQCHTKPNYTLKHN